MLDFLRHLFDSSGFPPRWYCGTWTAGHGWLHICSDLAVWSAYVAIPCVLGFFVLRRKDIPFRAVFLLFGAFILACGTTHLMEAIIFWWPAYRLAGVIKLFTAVVSWGTVIALIPVTPKALAMRSPTELEREVTARKNAEEALQRANAELKARFDALQATEERFRLHVDGTKDYAIFLLDKTGRVVSWNPGAERVKQYQAREVIGQYVSIFYSAEEVNSGRPEEELRLAAAEGKYENEGWRLRKDGSRFWASVVIATVLRNEGGELKGFSKVTRDLTESRRAEESLRASEERFRAFSQSTNDAIIAADSAGLMIFWNKGADNIFGYAKEEVLQQPLTLIMPESYHDAHQTGLVRFQSTGVSRVVGKTVELQGRRKDGSVFPLELSLASWQTGEQRFYGGIIRDITARKHVEEKMAAFARQLQRSNHELEQFASVASHDLQEPLRKIQAFGDRLEAKCRDALDEQGLEYLARMQSSATRMRALIEELLAFSRLATKGERFLTVNLGQVAREVVTDLEASIQQARGRVIVGDLPTVEADATQMRQLFQNLISNALKFYRADESPVVQLEGHVFSSEDRPSIGGGKSSPICQITVTDNGIGFDEIYLDRIFEVFQRLHSRQEYEGTGMGLAICRKIVEGHGGSITARSTPEKGATFIVTLPVTQQKDETHHVSAS